MTSKRLVSPFTLLALIAGTAAAQNRPQQPPGYTETVEVKVRTVIAIVTDAQGKRPVLAPSASDLEVLEDGAPAEIVAVELLPRPRSSAAGVPSSSALPPDVAAESKIAPPVSQVLYVDPQFVYRGSAHTYLQTLLPVIEAMAAREPLRVVVAGPSRVSVVVEELKTGLFGSGSLELPR